jgi:uncharacterized heparinase superfamily protein
MKAAVPGEAPLLERAARLWRTARHLRPVQVWNRVSRRLVRGVRSDVSAVALALPRGPWATPVAAPSVLVAPGRVSIHEVERDIAGADDWLAPDMAALWRYHLHYFDDLGAPADARRVEWQAALVERWIRENPPGRPPAWDPYPVSLRTVNWLKWALAGHGLSPAAVASLAFQAGWLERRLEFHLLANHLFENAKALWFAGACMRGDAASRWLRRGRALALDELREQVLADGGHFERSPMYHARMLENVLDLANLERACGREPSLELRDAATRMLAWLAAMSHPDGGFALLNDAAAEQAPALAELRDYARALGVALPPVSGSRWLADSGYVRLEDGPWVAIADLAPVGPDYQPGHAHADTLTFEASLRGRRLVVDTGTSTYEPGARRSHERSTAAHNVLAVQGVNSSEVWAGFRVGRRARVVEAETRLDGPSPWAAGAHDGYLQQRVAGLCRRRWQIDADVLRVEDRLEGVGEASVEWLLHLHPSVRVQPAGPARFRLECDGRAVATFSGDPALCWFAQPSTYHPRFGVSEPNWRIRGEGRVALPASFRCELSATSD